MKIFSGAAWELTGAAATDATAAANHPELGNGYEAALTNFKFMASAVLSTEDAVSAMA